jgi:hypothetical protein
MFDKYIVVADSLRNVTDESGDVTGYSVQVRIPYYRGLGLSMVQVDLVVDGEAVPPRGVTVAVHGNEYKADELGDVLDDRWGFTEPATLTVAQPGGLTEGEHSVSATVHLRISYTGGSVTSDTKTLAVA